MAFTNTLFIAGILVLSSAALAAQEARPAIVPVAQGGGPSASSSVTSPAFIGGLSDGPIAPGDTVHINVFDAPDFSIVTRVSERGDVPYPILGSFHIAGLNSGAAARELARVLKDRNLMADPEVTITLDSTTTGITILGEVHSPGVYAPPGKRYLSDLIAVAGGLTANTGRMIEITNEQNPGKKEYVPWDPTMQNTENFDHSVSAGDRVLVRACGIAYVGGNVGRPGAYSLCGSPQVTLSEIISLAGGVGPSSALKHTYLFRAQPDGRRVARQIDIKKVLTAKVADPVVCEDDIIYLSPSPMKVVLKDAVAFALSITPSVLYLTAP